MTYSLLISDLHLDPARPEHLAALETLLEVLGRDDRHHSVRILHRSQREDRLFPKWAMRRAGVGAENELAVIGRSNLPFEMRAEIERFGAQRKAG